MIAFILFIVCPVLIAFTALVLYKKEASEASDAGDIEENDEGEE